jgi:hypothetical protein
MTSRPEAAEPESPSIGAFVRSLIEVFHSGVLDEDATVWCGIATDRADTSAAPEVIPVVAETSPVR